MSTTQVQSALACFPPRARPSETTCLVRHLSKLLTSLVTSRKVANDVPRLFPRGLLLPPLHLVVRPMRIAVFVFSSARLCGRILLQPYAAQVSTSYKSLKEGVTRVLTKLTVAAAPLLDRLAYRPLGPRVCCSHFSRGLRNIRWRLIAGLVLPLLVGLSLFELLMFEIVADQESPETVRKRRCLIQDLVGGSAVVYF